ncbi:MAG: dihydroorotate dehydrogenase electron transfer subunit [bacterium]|nr:dihydroorotate dehydrogenase electron transfer subunit [bacterium]
MKEEKCIVVKNENIIKDYYLLELESEYIAERAKPGNFVMLAVSGNFEPLLKRPFGILDARPPVLRFYYEIIGKGTKLMAGLKPGTEINAIGPLGNSVPPLENKNILLVAGGRGVAPLYYAMEDYVTHNNVYLIYGGRSKDDLNLMEEIEEMQLQEIFLYTDDGSKGRKGFVTADINEIIAEKAIDVTISCGPEAMFESLAHTLTPGVTENYVSLEAMMGCGFGICYSCVVKTAAGGYMKVCTNGPVCKMEEIAWET